MGAERLFLDGSFVTAKAMPNDVDAVVLLPTNFAAQVAAERDEALELADMLVTRQPNEIFGAESISDWDAWKEFFSQTREPDGRRKGLVELIL